MRMLDVDRLAPETVRPISRAEYERMVALGMFEDERVELLCGVLVQVSPQGTPHAEAIQRINIALTVAVHGMATPRVQLPFAASDDSEPEPDFASFPSATTGTLTRARRCSWRRSPTRP